MSPRLDLRLVYTVITLVFVILSLPITAWSYGYIQGYVFDDEIPSNPIEGALIIIYCGGLYQYNTTNSNGFYFIDDITLIDCYWNVSASKKGYATSCVEMSIDINSTHDFILKLSNKSIYVGGHGPNNYSKIQYAIDNASNGDTIFVFNGIYQERIYINKVIYLNGENRNKTIIDGGGNGDVIRIRKNFVSISNFTIHNRSIDEIHDGIIISDCYDITIVNNNFIGCGISYKYLTPNIINFRNNIKNNIVNGKPLVYIEKETNKIIDYPSGQIILSDCSNITITNQNISYVHNAIILYHSDNCTIYKNNITNTSYGIVLYYSNFNNITKNKISKNLRGIIYGASSNTLFLKNIIKSNEKGIYDNISPFVRSSNNNKITRNIIKNNYEGVQLLWTKPAFIRYNNVENNNYIGVWISYSSESFIENNNFYINKKDVFITELINSNNTIINGNYWNKARFFPKIISGRMIYGEGLFNIIPWIFIDWNPAKEPYDISSYGV